MGLLFLCLFLDCRFFQVCTLDSKRETVTDLSSLNTFVIASSMISAGLNWWQALIATICGYCMVGPLIVLSARPVS